MAAKTPKYRAVANPEMAAAMRGLRRSSAAQPHDNRPNRARTRSASKRAAVRSGW